MQKHLKVLALFAALVALAGCAATVKETMVAQLSPAVELAWPGVAADALRGAATAPDSLAVYALDEAVATGRCDEAARVAETLWPSIELMALRGIYDRQQAAEIGAIGASRRIERVEKFGRALELCGDPTDPEGDNVDVE